ncbi:MAG: hypothetical protein CMG55_05100 [Candidatus Marinimicrobia bacterium]|nr:hypothetical protein [Candidatus Neomarinimicrobiota bacterium]
MLLIKSFIRVCEVIRLLTPIVVLIFCNLFSDPIDSYWQQRVNYDMDITLHDSIRQITGKTIIKYTNNSPDSLDRIYMHLYPNAFQVGSVKYREYIGNAGRESRAKYFKDRLEGFTSKIDIHEFSIALPKDGSSWIHKTPIMEGYIIDDTILEAKLFKKIPSGETVRIDIDWTHHVGDMVERAGFYQDQYNMAQWYPKLAVYDEKGWHPDVFHAEGEFYGEFGDFNVNFDLPYDFIIAASGVVIKGNPGWESVAVDTSIDFSVWLDIYDSTYTGSNKDKRRQVSFFAENVHDFAWVASKDFLYEGGISRDGETNVHVLYDKNRGEDWTKVVLERSINALAWLEEIFGDYPYPQITTTDRIKSGGMEYPMLVMNGRDSESLIVHEYGHIYFYGILANNEVEEAWIDEGFTTNQTRDYMMNRYGKHGFDINLYEGYDKFPKKYWPLNNSLHSDQWSSIRYMISGYDENISRPSYLFKNATSYSRNAYGKPSLMLTELKYILGDSLFYESIQYFYDKWKLKHINEQKFIHAVEENTGQELDWFFDPWLHTTRKLDYGISFFRKIKENNKWNIELGIKNEGLRFLPILVETEFEDGSKERQWWDKHLWRFNDTLRFSVTKKPKAITLDPDVQTMDLDYRNNTTKLKKKIIFNWPSLAYRPRNEMIYRWMPNFYYDKNGSDFAPGLNLEKSYGLYENTILETNYALNSQNIYWYLSGWRQPVHYFPRTKFYFWGFNKPGVKEYGLEVEKKWNRVYGRTSTHIFSGGFYMQPQYDSTRANALGYNPQGKLSVGYLNWDSNIGPVYFTINAASTFSYFSTWDFNRLTLNSNFKKKISLGGNKYKKNRFGLNYYQRFIVGKIWAKSFVPGQEGYNIEGNSSNDLLKKKYLVDQFYGQEQLFLNYHMPGEGNLRGFVNSGERGAEALISSSSEIGIDKNLLDNKLNFAFTIFADAGTFWDREKPSGYSNRVLADAGFGVNLKTKIFEKYLFCRIDLPFLIYNVGETKIDKNNWVFSFQRSI